MICHRCHADAVAGTISSMPLCWTCIRQVKGKMGKTFVGAAMNNDVQNASILCDVGPYVAPVPYYAGKAAGTAAKDVAAEGGAGAGKALSDTTGAVKDITSTVKTLAIAGVCFGGAFLIYTMWRAHKMQERAISYATEHPEVVKAALLA